MKAVFLKQKLSVLAFIFSLVAVNAEAQGTSYVSNLGNPWTEGGIGDIHGLFPGGASYGNDTARFTTGFGNFSVSAMSLDGLQWLCRELGIHWHRVIIAL